MPRTLPVTLVAGFLGAGKTSLLHHLVTEHTGGHLALLVEKSAELNFDARALRGLCGAMRRSHDRVAEFSEASDLTALLSELIRDARHERVLIETSGLTQPSYWVRALQKTSAQLPVNLEQVVCVIDLLDFHRTLIAPGPDATLLIDFQRSLISQATLLVLNKCDLMGDAERMAATQRLRELNRNARILEVAYSEAPPAEILREPGFDGASTPDSGEPSEVSMPDFESVVYRAFRPFHPQRLWNWFNAPHAGLLRVKGLIWLATRNLLVGGISRTAWQNSCGAAGIWWAALPREEWPSDPSQLARMQRNWREPFGDRRQELVLIGARGPASDAARKLNLCLLGEAEYAMPDWRGFADPFPEWDVDQAG